MKRSFARWFVALIVAALVLGQGTWVLAGTTGVLSGTLTDATTNQPVVGAKITAASPSQTVTSRTDNTGHFVFLSLAPDTYTVSADYQGYDTSSVSGVTIVADQTRTLSVSIGKSLTTIANVKSRSASSLVKPGTTADVYSVGATQQAKVAVAGGGGNLNSAWSALSTVPGVAICPARTATSAPARRSASAAATTTNRLPDRRRPRQPRVRQLPVGPGLVSRSARAASLHRRTVQTLSPRYLGFINQVIRTGIQPRLHHPRPRHRRSGLL